MKKLLVLLLALLLAAAPCALADSINIYTWDGYFNPETISAFTEETGIEVNFSPFASNEDMLVVMENGAAYDIVLASDYALNILRKADLLQPLDMEALTNYENLDPAYLNQYYDPDGPARRCWSTTPNWLRAKSLPLPICLTSSLWIPCACWTVPA